MRFLPAVEMTGVSREKMEGGEAAASPPPHLLPYPQWHGVISTAGRNLPIHLKIRHYELFDFLMVVSLRSARGERIDEIPPTFGTGA